MRINKKIPVVALKALMEFISTLDSYQSSLFHIEAKEELLLNIIDNDLSSGFYFEIQNFESSNGLLLKYKPQSQVNTSDSHLWVPIGDLDKHFQIWLECIVAYDELEKLYKDPFLKNLEDQFFADFDLDDETKNDPLSLKQINYLEENLSKIENSINEYRTESNGPAIEEIIFETKFVKTQLGKQTKEWIAKKVSTVLAKITKEGPNILKGIFKEAGKQLMTQGIKFLLENGDKLLS